MPKLFWSSILTLSLLSLVACRQEVAPAPSPDDSAKKAEAGRQLTEEERQREIERLRKADENLARLRAELEARLKEVKRQAEEADRLAKAKAADAALTKPAVLKDAMAFQADAKILLPVSGKQVVAHLRAKEEVSHDLLTQAFLDLHFAQRKPTHPDTVRFEAFRKSVEPLLVETVNDPGNFKRTLEQKLTDEFSLKEIRYDKDKVNLLDAFKGHTQCYSGTALYTVFYRLAAEAAGDRYKEQYPVILFTKGHIVPGYFVRFQHQWILYEVETTQAGTGVERVGTLPYLKTQAIRVVLVDDFLLSEVLKHAALPAELEKFRTAALERAAKTFDLPLAEMEAEVKKIPAGGALDPKVLNSGVFAFGKSEETAGSKPRVYHRSLPAVVAKVTLTAPETRRELNPAWKPGDSPGHKFIDVPTGKTRSWEQDAAPAIFSQVLNGDEAAVKKYLAERGNPDLFTTESFHTTKYEIYLSGATLLNTAIRGNRLAILEMLLDAGADAFATGSSSFSDKSPAIVYAINQKQPLLLAAIAKRVKNVDLPLSTSYGRDKKLGSYTALALAVEANDSAAVKALLDAGAKPSADLGSGYTVKDHAAFLKRVSKIGAPVADQLR